MDYYYYLFSVKQMILGNACDATQTKVGSLEKKLIYKWYNGLILNATWETLLPYHQSLSSSWLCLGIKSKQYFLVLNSLNWQTLDVLTLEVENSRKKIKIHDPLCPFAPFMELKVKMVEVGTVKRIDIIGKFKPIYYFSFLSLLHYVFSEQLLLHRIRYLLI